MSTRQLVLNDPDTPDFLRDRLTLCGKPVGTTWGYCRQVACDWCRRYRREQWVSEALQAFQGQPVAGLRCLDIAIGSVERTTKIIQGIRATKKRLRNVVHRLRQSNRYATAISAIGGIIIDRLYGRWVISLRVIIDLGRMHELRLGDMIERIWGGRDNARLSYVEASDIPHVVGAALDFSNIAQWEVGTPTELFSLLSMKRNFSTLRFRLRSSRKGDPDGVSPEPRMGSLQWRWVS